MLMYPEYTAARDALLDRVSAVGTEQVSLLDCAGRVLAQEVRAEADVPAFDRSPYDGYAFRAVTDQPLFYLALVMVILGVLLFCTGFICEMISRTSTDRNRYNIQEEL